jgi:hypothetical protein
MVPKTRERDLAIKMRREGLSYREILQQIPVSKSSLSLWLRSVQLAKRQRQILTAKRYAAVLKGGQTRRRMRLQATEVALAYGRNQIQSLSEKEKLLIGVALYWAEGSKQKERLVSAPVSFGNSDPRMANLFIRWLREVVGCSLDAIRLGIYLHTSHAHRVVEVRRYWIKQLKVPVREIPIYFKKGNPKTKRYNTAKSYYGLIRISVLRSTQLNRIINGWIEGVCNHWGVV